MAHHAYSGVGISSFWNNAADDHAVFDFHIRATAAITTAAKAKGLNYDFLYINDANPIQEPFKYYGKGRSLPKMRLVAKKYGTSSLSFRIEVANCNPAIRPLWRVSTSESGNLETLLTRGVGEVRRAGV